jgi:hypothetical protein
VWSKRNCCTYQITSSGAVKNNPCDEARRKMARCGVRFSTGSTTRRQINGSAVHHLVLYVIAQWKQPREWTRFRLVSHCLVQCGLANRQKSPGPADLGASTPVQGHNKRIYRTPLTSTAQQCLLHSPHAFIFRNPAFCHLVCCVCVC